ncbi:MAG: AIR synthase [Methanosarcinaceae archaeon]|nr:AIR synthase [Methanosarcinaceae archaeon]
MIGKINDSFFKKHILKQTGSFNNKVIVGPKMGVDSAILKVGDKFMAVAEDPIFPGASTTPEDFAKITVHIGASDVAVTGIKPQFLTYSLLLPPNTSEEYIADFVKAMDEYTKSEGISIVGGHTGFYGSVTVPTIGGITVWGFGDDYTTPSSAKVGDKIIITKGVAIEAVGLLAYELEEKLLRDNMSQEIVTKAKARFHQMTVIDDALIAFSAGGGSKYVHAMHDATEGGLFRGLYEIADASNVGILIREDDIILPEDVSVVCDYFSLNPYEIISEGTLIITCDASVSEKIIFSLEKEGIESAVIGEVVLPENGCCIIDSNQNKKEFTAPEVDKFWEVFFNALELKDDTRTPYEIEMCNELDDFTDSQISKNIYKLLAEIGSNIAYQKDLKSDSIASLPGRFLKYKNETKKLGKSDIGTSYYMATSLKTIKKHFKDTKCVMNLSGKDSVFEACKKAGLNIIKMPDAKDFRQTDEEFFSDLEKTVSCFKSENKTDKAPDAILVPDRINLEKVILLIADNLESMDEKIDLIMKNIEN